MNRRKVVLSGCALLVCAGIAGAAETHYLLNPSIGLNRLEDTDFTFSGPTLGKGGFTAEFEPGARLDFSPRWRVYEGLSLGFDFGYIYSAAENRTALSVMGTNTSVFDVDLDYHQIPFLGVGTFEFQNSSRFTPFVTAGAGVVMGILDGSIGGLSDSERSAAMAYQFGAGFMYEFSETMGVGMVYKLLGTANMDFDFMGGDSIKLDDTINHMIGVTFRLKF